MFFFFFFFFFFVCLFKQLTSDTAAGVKGDLVRTHSRKGHGNTVGSHKVVLAVVNARDLEPRLGERFGSSVQKGAVNLFGYVFYLVGVNVVVFLTWLLAGLPLGNWIEPVMANYRSQPRENKENTSIHETRETGGGGWGKGGSGTT